MADSDIKSIQLEGHRLQHARRHATSAQDHLMALAELVLDELDSEMRADDLAEIRIRPYNLRVIQLDGDGNCVGVYEDPPGICRSC